MVFYCIFTPSLLSIPIVAFVAVFADCRYYHYSSLNLPKSPLKLENFSMNAVASYIYDQMYTRRTVRLSYYEQWYMERVISTCARKKRSAHFQLPSTPQPHYLFTFEQRRSFSHRFLIIFSVISKWLILTQVEWLCSADCAAATMLFTWTSLVAWDVPALPSVSVCTMSFA